MNESTQDFRIEWQGEELVVIPSGDIESMKWDLIEQAAEIVGHVGEPNCRILFDCYHVQINQGDLLRRFEAHRDLIGHVQFAGVPERGEPDRGELAYERLLPALRDLGYRGAFGAEYRPMGRMEDSLSWMNGFDRR